MDSNRMQNFISLAALVMFIAIGSRGLYQCSSFHGLRYSDPLLCTDANCASRTMTVTERAMVAEAYRILKGSDYVLSGRGRVIFEKISELDDEGLVNIWSSRDPVHSSYSASRGIMINRHYDELSPELVAMMLVHEGTHAALPGSSITEEVSAHYNALDFYEEIRLRFADKNDELEYMREVRMSGRFHEVFNCGRDLYRSRCNPGKGSSFDI